MVLIMNSEQLLQLTAQLSDMMALLQSVQKEKEELRAMIEELKNDNALLKEENNYLKRKLFGTKSETSHSLGFDQLSFFDEAEQECDEEVLNIEGHVRHKKKYKDQIKIKLSNLPQEDVLLTLPENEKECPRCGHQLKAVGKEYVRQEVQFIPAKLKVINYYRETFECRACKKDGSKVMVKTGVPAPVIPHSYASAESVAHIMKEKYVNGVPLYRQETEWKRLGLDLNRATMANWVIIVAQEWLMPLKRRMHQLLIQENYVHCDETTVQVLNEPGKDNTTKSYMWVYSSIKESPTPIRIFEYKPTRAGYNPKEFLKGFKGKVITDGYAGYNQLLSVTNVYCWAHCRRKFRDSLPDNVENIDDTLAKQGLDQIKELFKIEDKIKDLTPEEKAEIRQKEAKPLLDKFFAWCEESKEDVLSKSKIHQAFQYTLNLRKGLSEYINDGYLPMTNSLDERTIRPFAVGRKNWLFSASPKGADASAATYSIIETAKANGLDPYKYLCFVFKYLPSQDLVNNPESLDMFLPWSKESKENCKVK